MNTPQKRPGPLRSGSHFLQSLIVRIRDTPPGFLTVASDAPPGGDPACECRITKTDREGIIRRAASLLG